MNGAIFYSSKYGSTKQYSDWIAEATGLPVFDTASKDSDPSDFDFVVIASPIIYYKLRVHRWVRRNLAKLAGKHIILVTVSGAPAGEKLDGWIADSLPTSLIERAEHVALRGRQIKSQLTWFDKINLIIGAMKNPDPVARREELKGFDYMDRSSIEPVVDLIRQLQLTSATT